jgi:GntR family transcriptional regulator
MQLRDDLMARLEGGEFVDGFPGELALTGQYGVSRHTVREALRRLRADGLVTAERGRAPRLAAPVEIEQPLGALYSLFASVEAAGLVQRSVTRRLEIRTDGVYAARLGVEESTPLLYLERLRLAGEQPFAADRVWLPAAVAAPLLQADFAHTALYTELANRCGLRLHGGREHISAVVPTPAQRSLLGMDVGVAAFAIERLGCADGRPVEWRHTLVRGDRFSVVAHFSPRTGYRVDLAATPPGRPAHAANV